MGGRVARKSVEWPTVGLIALTYVGWGILTFHANALGVWLTILLLIPCLVLHSSLQHESIHGHPFRDQALNAALMLPGLGLVIPYGRFRDLHLAHHKDANLTDPYDDPESAYFDPRHFYAYPLIWRLVLVANNSFAGRFLLGPLVGLEGFYRTELRMMLAGSRRVIRDWVLHALSVIAILVWISQIATIPFWAYLISAYLAQSVLKIRTFVEHQAHALASARSVIIEDRGPLAFLFLNNNLHSVHHAHPQVPWYDLPALFRSRRETYLHRNRGYYFGSYLTVIMRFFLRPKEPVPHPFYERDR